MSKVTGSQRKTTQGDEAAAGEEISPDIVGTPEINQDSGVKSPMSRLVSPELTKRTKLEEKLM